MSKKKDKCAAGTPFCSGEVMATYGVNGSEKEKKTFRICGVCAMMLRRNGAKLKRV